MKDTYIVSHMTKDELPLAVDWAAKMGWNPGLNDADCFYQADPRGFFAGKLNGKIIAVGSAVIYDDAFAFCGFYIVDEAYRGHGYGLTLTKKRLAYIGNRNAGLDGVVNMVDKYERLGYRVAHNNARYQCVEFNPAVKNNRAIISLRDVNFNELLAYDRQHFPALRKAFLHCWINQGNSLGYIQDGKLSGYGVIRACREGYKIGPLFAENAFIANELFLNLAVHAQGQPIYLDIPENNPHALDLVKRYQLKKVFETARMYLKDPPPLPIQQIYGITTYELG